MNPELLLEWAMKDAEDNDDFYLKDIRASRSSEAALAEDIEVLSRNRATLPASLPKTEKALLGKLRKHFSDDVTLISRVMNHYFPEKYIYYRVSKLEAGILDAIDELRAVPEFEKLTFTSIGKRGFGRYLLLNEAMLSLFGGRYPELVDLSRRDARISWFLYRGLGELFVRKSSHERYWIMVTGEEFFGELDSGKSLTWSARKEMRRGDRVLMYRKAPVSAVTDIFEVRNDPYFDPFGGWDGFWVDIERTMKIEPFTFQKMKNDELLGEWSLVRKRFQGVITEPVPEAFYDRISGRIVDPVIPHHAYGNGKLSFGKSGMFSSEASFSEEEIEPLLRKWGMDYRR